MAGTARPNSANTWSQASRYTGESLASLASLLVFQQCAAFAPAFRHKGSSVSLQQAAEGGMSSELGLPCEDECALTSFPNLPESVHPGVLSGKAQMDLLKHAKENGE